MKRLWSFFPALLLIAGIVLMGCPNDPPADITYSAVADGVKDTTPSTKITFTFNEEVTGLAAGDITITDGTGKAAKGALTGSAKVWTLGITGVSQGDVKVKIAKSGIEGAEKTVAVYSDSEPDEVATTELTDDLTENQSDNHQGWNVETIWDAVVAAKYLVLELEGDGGGDNEWGFGGIQIALNRDGDAFTPNWGQSDIVSDWLGYSRSGTFYMVIQLDTLDKYDDFVADEPEWAQIFLGYWGAGEAKEKLGLQKAYLTSTELMPAPEGSTAIENGGTTYGYIAAEVTLD